MVYSFAFHIIGIVMWVGGLMMTTRMLVLAAAGGVTPNALSPMAKRMWMGFIIPGLVIVTLSGLHQWSSGGFAHYMSQGWFHGKITLVLALYVITFLYGSCAATLARGEAVSRGKLMAIHGSAGLILVVITFLTFLSRA